MQEISTALEPDFCTISGGESALVVVHFRTDVVFMKQLCVNITARFFSVAEL